MVVSVLVKIIVIVAICEIMVTARSLVNNHVDMSQVEDCPPGLVFNIDSRLCDPMTKFRYGLERIRRTTTTTTALPRLPKDKDGIHATFTLQCPWNEVYDYERGKCIRSKNDRH